MKCKYSKQCGGCEYLGTAYPETLHKKRKYLQQLFPKEEIEMVRGMENPCHYRHKVYATFSGSLKSGLKAGMYKEGTHRVIETDDCLIQNETANSIIRDFVEIANAMHIQCYHEDTGTGCLRHLYLRVSHARKEVMLVIVIGSKILPGSRELIQKLVRLHPEIQSVYLNHNNKQTSMILSKEPLRLLYGKKDITDVLGELSFHISPRSFYQVNPVMAEVIYKTAMELADIQPEEEVLDLCCGIGTITLYAAKYAKHVTGIEIVPEAIRDAKANARENEITNASFYCSEAGNYLSQLEEKPDVVILDPPRSGMSNEAIQAIIHRKIKRLVYISCESTSLKRDYALLRKAGYRIQRFVPVDLFPFTTNIESVVFMNKSKNESVD